MKLRTAVFSAVAALGLAGGAVVGLAATATAAGAAPPPPPHVLTVTSVQVSAIPLTPRALELNFDNYTPSPHAPGFVESSTLLAVCIYNHPHFAGIGHCSWVLTSTTAPHPTLDGIATTTPVGAIGRILGGTGVGHGARGLLSVRDIAPNTSIDTFVYHTPTPQPVV